MATTPLNVVALRQPSTAANLQAQLRASEEHIDLGVINAGELIGKTIRAANEAGVPRPTIQRMLLRLHSTIAHGLKAQWDFQAYHQQCRQHLSKLDLEVLGWGDTGNSPPASMNDVDAAELASLD